MKFDEPVNYATAMQAVILGGRVARRKAWFRNMYVKMPKNSEHPRIYAGREWEKYTATAVDRAASDWYVIS